MLEYLVIALLVVVLVNTALLYKVRSDLQELLSVNKAWGTPFRAEKDLDGGRFDDVIARCLEEIYHNPLHVKAHWYLGKAYYAKEMWHEAKEEMETVAQLEPAWRREGVQPYLDEIERRLEQLPDDRE